MRVNVNLSGAQKGSTDYRHILQKALNINGNTMLNIEKKAVNQNGNLQRALKLRAAMKAEPPKTVVEKQVVFQQTGAAMGGRIIS